MPTHPGSDTVEVLRDALLAVGLGLDFVEEANSGADIVVVEPSGVRRYIEVKRLSLASAANLDRLAHQWIGERRSGMHLVVADRVTSEARAALRAQGWGWLDLRGHLHLEDKGLFVDADVPALRFHSRSSGSLAGRVGLEVASLLLLEPDRPAAVRKTAAALGRAPSSVSSVLAAMGEEGLLRDDRRPAVPGLFWALAGRWRSNGVDVESLPVPGGGPASGITAAALRLGLDQIESSTGWALADTMAAAAYGAPVTVRSDAPLDFYVPDEATLRRAVHLLGAARGHDARAATLRVAPVPLVCSRRVELFAERWPVAQRLFVALDLAQDPGRGREIVDAWTPDPAGTRAW